jgi:cell division protein FtsX
MAAVLVMGVLFSVEAPIQRLSLLYESDFQLNYPGALWVIALLGISSLLGIAGAWTVLLDQFHNMNADI